MGTLMERAQPTWLLVDKIAAERDAALADVARLEAERDKLAEKARALSDSFLVNISETGLNKGKLTLWATPGSHDGPPSALTRPFLALAVEGNSFDSASLNLIGGTQQALMEALAKHKGYTDGGAPKGGGDDEQTLETGFDWDEEVLGPPPNIRRLTGTEAIDLVTKDYQIWPKNLILKIVSKTFDVIHFPSRTNSLKALCGQKLDWNKEASPPYANFSQKREQSTCSACLSEYRRHIDAAAAKEKQRA